MGKSLEIGNIRKSFGGIMAIMDITFNANPGEITSIIGPNGAGKTTLINVISGIYKPDRGFVKVDSQNITGISPHKIVQYGIKRTFQNIQTFSNMTLLENIMVGFHFSTKFGFISCMLQPGYLKKQEKKVKENSYQLLEELNLENYANFYPSELPYGIQKKLEIARTLAGEPDVLLFDEPVAGLNISESDEISNIILSLKERGKTIILIEHDMNVVMDISDKIICLHYGEKIAEGKPSEIQRNQKVINAYLGSQ